MKFYPSQFLQVEVDPDSGALLVTATSRGKARIKLYQSLDKKKELVYDYYSYEYIPNKYYKPTPLITILKKLFGPGWTIKNDFSLFSSEVFIPMPEAIYRSPKTKLEDFWYDNDYAVRSILDEFLAGKTVYLFKA